MTKQVVVIDYGIGNVFSVCNALKEVNVDAVLSGDLNVIKSADRIVLPGVGAFSRAMSALKDKGIDDAIRAFVETERPFLGICIGMQVLMQHSTEMGTHQGLGLIEGIVDRIDSKTTDGARLLVPHISWAQLHKPKSAPEDIWNQCVLPQRNDHNPAYYFVHSYSARPVHKDNLLAEATYGGHALTAAIKKNNITGLQFHPERSGKAGLELLNRFTQI
ncbi:imidazole glycerol phosphate synthase subunit HisH [Cohaesibacter celericrescens]|uniref:Imidazole glycerol phosphate synthase subunit HisH n=1 Tax=Cohaesibacter celericrescens TaxID=2067669 RepID=A0A2N5XUE5_9HYPH|nr:imidazole glycerol phosphate synthase subunit HisH [Cohaesibacter celericrescens]PLW78142.1 imidazole glycerol phosphate synthase subunit HisH [Cohaesibacter celericrescens]